MFEKTLVCLDGSKLAEQILPYITQSCQANNSEIILLQVIAAEITIPPLQSVHVPPFIRKSGTRPATISDIGSSATLEPEVGAQLSEIAREEFEAKRYLDAVARPLRKIGLKVRTVALEGDVVETVLAYAAKHKISLIALTTHGNGGLKHGTLGKVTQSILKGWNLPVLVIKPTTNVQQT
jgi:nucleotide-binding universal stress UspA family protein